MPPAAVLVATALTALAAIAAGCGGPPATEARDRRVAVALDDFSIAPQRIDARRGRLRIAIHNRGRINHTLVLMRDGREHARTTPSLPPDARGALELDLRTGEYRMICVIANHEELGMSGTITVVSRL